ncbi:MAG: 1-phosphofructokinase family hexose kinase [Candidatus Aminicenantes bacterium]|jgi:6-phosphofructokinase 2
MKTKKIIALCIKPSLDISSRVLTVVSGPKLRCSAVLREPGGGGINVCRAVKELGGEALVFYPEGGISGRLLQSLLEKEGIERVSVRIESMIPENFMVKEESSGKLYRFNFPGAELSENEWKQYLEKICQISPKPDYVVGSGGLPPGAPDDFYARAARATSELGGRFILDTHGPALIEAAKEGVSLIKANMKEFQDLVQKKVENENQVIEFAREEIREKRCEALVISLGASGAILVSERGTERFCAPVVPIRSRVGAGDSMVAGIVMKLAQNASLRNAVLFGTAAGSAAVMTPGTALCRREDTERLYEQMKKTDRNFNRVGS